jgi:hypothetical protein
MVRMTVMMLAVVALLTISGGRAFAADDDMAAKISAAKTAADHEALAAEYTTKASEAEASAVEHDKMAKAYLGKAGQFHGDHCVAVARRYRENARDLKALAEQEHAAAKAAK